MDIESFIERWGASGGAERTNYTQFLSELCRMLGVPEPEPTRPDDADNAYVFERSVSDPHRQGQGHGGAASTSTSSSPQIRYATGFPGCINTCF